MEKVRQHRRLAAILAADIVGYSRLIEADEAATLSAIRSLRAEIIDPLITEHEGRIVKLMGDGAIVEFASVVDAVACAVELQRRVSEKQVGVPQSQRVVFRIGVNLGDVVVEGDDLLGDGVNVAARLEQLCDPGGVLVSGAAYDHLQGKLGLPLDFTGEQQVKNIARPVRTYRVRLDGSGRGLRLRARRFRRWIAPAAAAALIVLVGSVIWMRPWEPHVEAASLERMALPLPDKPSLAVLPFNNIGGDPGQSYFADGMTEDLITDLSKLSGIFVIARNSSWTYKDKPTKPQQVAEDLGVRYVLEGSVRREGDQVRINAQLIDAVGGHHLWADRYDGAIGDVFALQDKVIAHIVAALAIELTNSESENGGAAETDSPLAYDALLQGQDYLRRNTEEDTLKAIALFENAIAIDPAYSRAYASLAAAQWRITLAFWFSSAGGGWQHAYDSLLHNLAKAKEEPTSLAYAISAQVLSQQGRYSEAFAEIDRAKALAPNDPDNHIARASVLNATGRAEEAEEEVRLAMRLDPQFAPATLRALAISLFNEEKYEEAAETLQRVTKQESDVPVDYSTLISALGHLGRFEGVAELREKYDALAIPAGYDPLTVQESAWDWYGVAFDYHRPYLLKMLAGLSKAGIPEGAGTDLALDDYVHFMSRHEGEFDVEGTVKVRSAEAKALRERGVSFIDVRAHLDFANGHVPGAINLSLPVDLSKETLDAVVGRDQEVVFYCHGKYCPYSAYGAAKARAWGHTNVYYFAGGFPEWQDAGYPIEVSPPQ